MRQMRPEQFVAIEQHNRPEARYLPLERLVAPQFAPELENLCHREERILPPVLLLTSHRPEVAASVAPAANSAPVPQYRPTASAA